MKSDIAIAVKDLSVRFNDVEILKNVSFEIKKGTFTGLIGPNGAGKSTLVKAILGFVEHTGTVLLNGRVGYVPQLSSFSREFPMTVYDFVKLPVRSQPNWKEKANEVLKEVGLGGFGPKLIGTLSGGEFQRVSLARALILEPEILILDEPESGVDEMGKAKFYTLLNDLKDRKQITVFMVSHDIGLIFEKCDNIMCLNKTLHCHGPRQNVNLEEVKRMFGQFDIWIRGLHHYETEHKGSERDEHTQ
ncbi:metal ABC transporter ATP-binding protein [Pseudothermotoga sp. U03pept]|uniref:metal ABC transporter ATP-binding protein n=1 Tax=Pseudothermotoga sp. U03pept TaxID=3447012 RepID=UPI003F110FA2